MPLGASKYIGQFRRALLDPALNLDVSTQRRSFDDYQVLHARRARGVVDEMGVARFGVVQSLYLFGSAGADVFNAVESAVRGDAQVDSVRALLTRRRRSSLHFSRVAIEAAPMSANSLAAWSRVRDDESDFSDVVYLVATMSVWRNGEPVALSREWWAPTRTTLFVSSFHPMEIAGCDLAADSAE
jgi:hypothetical protein